MWDKRMLIATVSAILGVLTMFTAMLQTIPLTVRYASISVMIVCELVFIWSFLSLGTQS